MERQWSLVAVLLLAVQARANPWVFGEDHPNFRNIYQINGHISPLTYNTRQIITIQPCMSLKYVWVKVSNTLGFTPTVRFHKPLNVVSITYGLLQHTGSDYSIVARGFRTPNCNPGVHQNDNSYIPYRLKGQNSKNLRSKAQKYKKNRLQRKGQDHKEASDAVDDLKDRKYEYDNDSVDKYDSIKESYEDLSNELKEVGSGDKRNSIIFIIIGKKASQQATGDNDSDVGHDRGSVKEDDGDDHSLDYGNGKDYSHKGSNYIGVNKETGGKGHAKSGGSDRGRGNAKGVSYRGTDSNNHSKKETYSDESGFNSDDRNSMISGYGGSNRHVKDKTSLGYGKGYGGSSNDENDQGDSYDKDSESYIYTKNKNSGPNIKGNGHRGSSNKENDKGSFYDGDIKYVGSNGHANTKGYVGSSRLDDDYPDGFGFGNKNQPDGRGKDISIFCSDYLRNNNVRETKNLAVDKKVIDYCLFQVGRSNS